MIAASLALAGVVWGLLTGWAFRRFTDPAALRIARKHLYAHLLEIRLFAEEPSLVWKAQKAIIRDNLRLLALVAKPLVILGGLFALFYSPLDSVYGWNPIAIGHSAVVTLRGAGQQLAVTNGIATNGIIVETPPIRALAAGEVSWRIRAVASGEGELRAGAESLRIITGDQTLIPKKRRSGDLEIDYPKTLVSVGGFTLPWLAWFLIFSLPGVAFVQPFTRVFRHS